MLLDSYTAERHAKAVELIEFDKDMARLFSEKPKSAEEAAQFQRYFEQHGRYKPHRNEREPSHGLDISDEFVFVVNLTGPSDHIARDTADNLRHSR